MQESQNCSLHGLRLVSRIIEEFQHPAIQTKIVQHLDGFFYQLKVCQPIGKKNSIQAICQQMRSLEEFLYFTAKDLEKYKIKIKKIY
jgi:hypothetical protein